MGPLWQQIAVYAFLVIAGAIAVWSGISAWRAIKRGECGSCPGCNGHAVDMGSVAPAKDKERIVFLPSDDLRRSAAGKARPDRRSER